MNRREIERATTEQLYARLTALDNPPEYWSELAAQYDRQAASIPEDKSHVEHWQSMAATARTVAAMQATEYDLIEAELDARRTDADEPLDFDQHDRNAAESERLDNIRRER